MTTTLIPEHKVRELQAQLEPEDMTSVEASWNWTLADAIREGSEVTKQMIGGWVAEDGEKMCALSAALLACEAHNFLS